MQTDVLLFTVNKHETQALLRVFEGATGTKAKVVPIEDRFYRDLGMVNGTRIFHALSEPGAAGPGAAQQAVDKAIRALNPGAVIAVGIAFGIDEEKQGIGDILLSKQLRLYDLQRVGSEVILRGDRPHASTRLINFFEGMGQASWKGLPVRPGLILTGDKLVDNFDYRERLIQFEPEAIGGEMEGAGLYVAGFDNRVDWIVIKAICDWADGEKSKDKTERQKIAASSAAEFVLHCLQQAPLQYPYRKRKGPPSRGNVQADRLAVIIHTKTFRDDHKKDQQFKANQGQINRVFPGKIDPQIVINDKTLRRAVVRVANFYEGLGKEINIGSLDEELLKNSLRIPLNKFYGKAKEYIQIRQQSNPKYYENLVWLHSRWDSDAA